MMLLNYLRSQCSTIIYGDYGGGKTSVLVAAAEEQTKKTKVYFISGLDSRVKEQDSIMDIALETKWKDSEVEVVTVRKMRAEGMGNDVSVLELIQQFLDTKDDPNISVRGSCSYFQSCIVPLFSQ